MQSKSERTRRQILDAAARVLNERGYAGTTVADIAKVVGIKAGSIYYHFDSKDDLVERVMGHSMEEVHDRVRDAVDALGDAVDPVERIRAAIGAHLDCLLDLGSYAQATLRLIGEIPDNVRRRQFGVQGEYGRYWAELLDAAQAAGAIRADVDPGAVRMLLLSAMNWVYEWPPTLRGDVDRLRATVQVVFLDGLTRRSGALDSSRESSHNPASSAVDAGWPR